VEKVLPLRYGENLKVMSIGFLLENESQAVIWRGPMKHNVIKQFVTNVEWGDLDYLIVDCPPGTGDEPLSVVQTLEDSDGAIVVTTPQDVAIADVRRCIEFCKEVNLPILGVVENMSGFICPHCGGRTDIFNNEGGKKIADESGTLFLGSIPIDEKVAKQADNGKPAVGNEACAESADAMEKVFHKLINGVENKIIRENEIMNKIAVPVVNGKLSMHFGHCEQFAVFEVDEANKKIVSKQMLEPPQHEPGALPRLLASVQVSVIIASGMGQRAQSLFTESGIEVVTGASSETPEEIVQAYLDGDLSVGENICDH
jgi:predicted Fe-Mo cluster-binding NifX family protein/CO dehydrogenase nickel-insertion accessory protein CooC1